MNMIEYLNRVRILQIDELPVKPLEVGMLERLHHRQPLLRVHLQAIAHELNRHLRHLPLVSFLQPDCLLLLVQLGEGRDRELLTSEENLLLLLGEFPYHLLD